MLMHFYVDLSRDKPPIALRAPRHYWVAVGWVGWLSDGGHDAVGKGHTWGAACAVSWAIGVPCVDKTGRQIGVR